MYFERSGAVEAEVEGREGGLGGWDWEGSSAMKGRPAKARGAESLERRPSKVE